LTSEALENKLSSPKKKQKFLEQSMTKTSNADYFDRGAWISMLKALGIPPYNGICLLLIFSFFLFVRKI